MTHHCRRSSCSRPTPRSTRPRRGAATGLSCMANRVTGGDEWVEFERTISTPFHKYDDVCCVDFRFWRGATREHPPKWGCNRGATKPKPKSDATLRAAVLFGPDVVAHSLQTPEGYALVPVRKHLAPRLGHTSLAANVAV